MQFHGMNQASLTTSHGVLGNGGGGYFLEPPIRHQLRALGGGGGYRPPIRNPRSYPLLPT